MLKTSLIEILRSFTGNESEKFTDFVSSPYHNKIKNLEKFYKTLKSYSPEFNSIDLGKEKVWSCLFPAKQYNYGTMKNLIHELTKLAEEFIVLEYSSKNELKKYYELADVLYERKILKTFISKVNVMDKMIKKHFLKNEINTIEEEFYLLFNLYGVKLSSLHMLKCKVDLVKDVNTTFELMISCFLIYFYKMYCNSTVFKERLNRENAGEIHKIFKNVLNEEGICRILENADRSTENYMKIMNAYFRMFKTIENKDVESYEALKKSIFDISGDVSGQYLFDLIINLHNSLVNLNHKSIDQVREYFDIHNLSIEKKCFLGVNGMITEVAFTKHIINSFFIKDSKKIKDFTNNFINKITETSREDCFNFSEGCLCFLRSDYSTSLHFFSKINFSNPVLKLMVMEFKIMNFYELNDYESFLYLMDSFKHYINYKNKPSIIYNYGYDFCILVKKLFELREVSDSYELSELRNIAENGMNRTRRWFIEKLDAIKPIRSSVHFKK